MELKYGKCSRWSRHYICFNRTFMELKSWTWTNSKKLLEVLIVPLWNWNTHIGHFLLFALKVLIVPLWNWNFRRYSSGCYPHSVLIVPLWNWNMVKILADSLYKSFNRTFMELKFRKRRALTTGYYKVLIVPLWNWNSLLTTIPKPPQLF